MGQFFLLCFVVLIAGGCRPSSLEECRLSGEKVIIELSQELDSIHSPKELYAKKHLIRKHMNKLANLMIRADQLSKRIPTGKESFTTLYSDTLQYQMMRLCEEVEEAKAVLEDLQAEVIDKITLYQNKQLKNKKP